MDRERPTIRDHMKQRITQKILSLDAAEIKRAGNNFKYRMQTCIEFI